MRQPVKWQTGNGRNARLHVFTSTPCGLNVVGQVGSVRRIHPNVLAVDAILAEAGAAGRVQILPAAVPTAAAAAELVGVQVGAIANSLVFATAEATPLLVLTSGAHRVDTAKVAALFSTATLSRATPEFVYEATGQRIGGSRPSAILNRCPRW